MTPVRWSMKRGAIVVLADDHLQCLVCGASWYPEFKRGRFLRRGQWVCHLKRGLWTCDWCGANSKTKLPIAEVLEKAS